MGARTNLKSPAPSSGPRLKHHVEIQGVKIPRMIYGTAWKEDATTGFVTNALETGFRGIDTANQRRHYHEAAVGAAVHDFLRRGTAKREDLFLQTKFTYVNGQDHRLPYDPRAPLTAQVEQSFASSLEHFGVDRLDAYLLHGPSFQVGISNADWETWRAMETLQKAGKTRLLGVSNVSLEQLEALHAAATVKPMIVQNRTFTRPSADRAVRDFCQKHAMAYEGFSLLTAITPLLRHPRIDAIVARTRRSGPEVIFRYALEQGMTALTGTTSAEHMKADLSVFDFELKVDEVNTIEALVSGARRG